MENNALNDLMQVISDDDMNNDNSQNNIQETNANSNEGLQNEPDYKSMYEELKKQNEQKSNENEERFKLIMEELSNLKNPKKQLSEQELQRSEYLKELGLDGIDEKLKRLEELDKKQQDKEAQDALMAKYTQVESELRKAYPDADLKAMAELATKLSGLSEANIDSWKTLLNLVHKTSNVKKADNLMSENNNIKTSDFNEKLKKGKVNEIDLGKELLSLV